MKQIIRNNWMYILGFLLGAIGGYAYWYYIGCSSGTCPITSSPLMSVIFGVVLGSTIGGMFKKEGKNSETREQ